ncbi:hypothetical protein LU631_02625 [Erwinia tracheiphila]|uniref:Uncharacterized protein n=1 Tax=Erwinia tracheiphila TaxID=65700 RepID=A0A0M2KI62_9GAMM|nr:hypothetical protein [Erwinia tracheiphila]AXF75419.1 hypothetical protein AV903_03740 [Erwinia tracheiphila]AXF76070.1 hypothetical protein AV903_08425 [Erwinia tracheiphila]EOS94724.1 hypothetical protein ETR_12138 [Erwinia tracheiphila PSU-1]KKF36997.1 hypothetical protein SY86_18700 [Erwinia tracheiphila]UIA82035.1 hypothetical protein LU604_15455 [Erwinia tracheiphila]
MKNTQALQRRTIYIGILMLILSMICVAMTIMFVYVSERSNQRVEEIRRDYQDAANRRDKTVDALSGKVSAMQQKLNVLPDQTADKTADAVKQAVAEDDKK